MRFYDKRDNMIYLNIRTANLLNRFYPFKHFNRPNLHYRVGVRFLRFIADKWIVSKG
jgi:hypothetical protein